MKVIEVVGNILEEASGPAHSVPALCQALAHEGAAVELHVNLGKKPENAEYRFCNYYTLLSLPQGSSLNYSINLFGI